MIFLTLIVTLVRIVDRSWNLMSCYSSCLGFCSSVCCSEPSHGVLAADGGDGGSELCIIPSAMAAPTAGPISHGRARGTGRPHRRSNAEKMIGCLANIVQAPTYYRRLGTMFRNLARSTPATYSLLAPVKYRVTLMVALLLFVAQARRTASGPPLGRSSTHPPTRRRGL